MRKFIFLPLLLLFVGGLARAQWAPLSSQGSNAAEGFHVFSGTTLPDITITWNAATTARYLMIFDGTPSSGTTTACSTAQATGCLLFCTFVPQSAAAPGQASLEWDMHPIVGQHGIVAAMSTGAGCGTYTVDGDNDFFYSQVTK